VAIALSKILLVLILEKYETRFKKNKETYESDRDIAYSVQILQNSTVARHENSIRFQYVGWEHVENKQSHVLYVLTRENFIKKLHNGRVWVFFGMKKVVLLEEHYY